MNLIEICIAFVAAIISVGTPLVFQVISKFDEKYQSAKVIDLFKKESKFEWLKGLIIATPAFALLYVLISFLVVFIHENRFSNLLFIISALLLLSTGLLLSQFIFFSFKVLKFSNPFSFVEARIKYLEKNTKTKRVESDDSMEVVTNFFLYSLSKELVDICTLIPRYMVAVSRCYEKNSKNGIVEFPDKFYESTRYIAQEFSLSESARLKKLENVASGFDWLIGSADGLKISEKTYNVLWSSLTYLVSNKKDDVVFAYWRRSSRYFEFELRRPAKIYSTPDSTDKVNQEEINQKEKERDEFRDFHYYLGGMLLSENRMMCIRKIWDHTNSEPPRYPLLPSTMGEIFNRYFKLCTTFDNELWEKAARFNFPKNDSINFDWEVNGMIKRYLVLLFLRQYTLRKYLMTQNYFSLPKSPDSQAGKRHWLECLPWFRERLEEYMADENFMELLRFDKIEGACDERGLSRPLALIDEFKERLEADLKQAEVEQPISEEKEKNFLTVSKSLIESATVEYGNVLVKESGINGKEYNSFYIGGEFQVVSKSDFADEQGYDHINYDSFLAESISTKLQMGISETFLTSVKASYLLKEEDLFPAIDRLGVIDKPEDFMIVSFRNNIKYFMDVLEVGELSSEKYKGIDIVDIWTCDSRLVRSMFFILRKSDKPIFVFEEPRRKWKETYEPKEQILSPEPIWASIIDLHKHTTVQGKLREQGLNDDLDDKVLVSIEMLAKISWKKTAKVIALVLANAYEDKGLPNKLEEVKPFNKN
ncbi:hypothetical protein [Sunxiuqinia elliptica]|uniref:Uncharacterized protein n=1 Tax=Sunxiuqinia elliptica TaxID=655355 RepID=A0A1I2I5C6_9BACT|nr:hypothetical protein [Sunxiuqinia elliptica]SFF36858.1 hypothetical protein SAMN05216283_105101 [Sunxiuqinia elliptica]